MYFLNHQIKLWFDKIVISLCIVTLVFSYVRITFTVRHNQTQVEIHNFHGHPSQTVSISAIQKDSVQCTEKVIAFNCLFLLYWNAIIRQWARCYNLLITSLGERQFWQLKWTRGSSRGHATYNSYLGRCPRAITDTPPPPYEYCASAGPLRKSLPSASKKSENNLYFVEKTVSGDLEMSWRSPVSTEICLRYDLHSRLSSCTADILWVMVIHIRNWQFEVMSGCSHIINWSLLSTPMLFFILRSRVSIFLFSSQRRLCFDKLNSFSLINRSWQSVFDRNFRINVSCLSLPSSLGFDDWVFLFRLHHSSGGPRSGFDWSAWTTFGLAFTLFCIRKTTSESTNMRGGTSAGVSVVKSEGTVLYPTLKDSWTAPR